MLTPWHIIPPAARVGFAKPTATDHRTWLWVITILSILYCSCFLLARVFAKWTMLWWDDAVLGLAHLMAIARWVITIIAIRRGLGTDLALTGRAHAETELANLAFSARILLIACLYTERFSIAIFTRKVFAGDVHREGVLFRAGLGLIAICGLASLLISAAGCHPGAMLIGSDSALCAAGDARWIVVTVLDIVSEIPLIVLPIFLVWKVQMASAKKRAVSYGFLLRIGIMVFAIVQAVLYLRFLDGGRTNIGLVPTLVFQELWLIYSLLSSTVPCLRSFVGAFTTNGLIKTNQTTFQHSNLGNSVAMSSIKHTNRSRRDDDDLAYALDNENFRPGVAYDVNVRHSKKRRGAERGEGDSLASDGSEQMIIKRDTQIEVQIEPRDTLEVPRYGAQY